MRRTLTLFSDLQTLLTAGCGLFLVLSFAFGDRWWAFLSVLCGAYFALKTAWDSLRRLSFDVNLLMVLAAAGAISLDRERDAAGLLFLFSLSSTLEVMAMAKTRSAIEGLVKLRPSQAILVQGESEELVPVERLVVGDLIRVRPFDAVPADSVVEEGKSSLDQSAMTGESVSVEKSVGDTILAGTQNLEGTLTARVTARVGDSALDRIVALVGEAQANKASGERISTWFGQRYTFFVIFSFCVSIAIRLGIGQEGRAAFYSSLTLLVAMSPCALVISIPATTLSALAWAARRGMLVRGGEFIELAGKVDVIAIDKTGTLTTGKPVVRRFAVETSGKVVRWLPGELLPSDDIGTALQALAAAEQYSSHPLAAAVVGAVERCGLEIPSVSDHRVIPGLGVEATLDSGIVAVGREQLVLQHTNAMSEPFRQEISAMEAEGMTVALGVGSFGVAAVGFSDSVREDAAAFVDSVRSEGVKRVVMLTGDRQAPAAALAKSLGIDEFAAALYPADKESTVAKLSKTAVVMMVGDGVNDAPSLARAPVGVAMGGLGSDVALNAADIVLMHDRLEGIPELIALGRRTNRTIRANLFFAGGMIVLLTLTSLAAKLPLPVAVVGHEGSTVLVILNGLRLLRGPRSRLLSIGKRAAAVAPLATGALCFVHIFGI